ncbi:hypothetical protein [Neobacillus mesonae]|uniref:hypothetical protein n=1 Tax=Neobacillus mesonae TaxID=1193713 RepID=UPI00203A9FB2|nr:hypothetical protein [Neobacillus mesonae]MCM3571260.1 hypothetical protein [Neobacillus mesonae]
MKKILSTLSLILIIILGISSLIFVIKMTWFPPTSMGMMMGKNMMLHHIFFWFSQMLIICFLFLTVIMIIWRAMNRNKDKK